MNIRILELIENIDIKYYLLFFTYIMKLYLYYEIREILMFTKLVEYLRYLQN